MIHTNVKQTSYSAKNGYVWRKLYQKQALSISMQTRDEVEAAKRSALMEIRFMQLAQLAVPFVAIRETLKAYRNELVMQSKIAFLASVAGNHSAFLQTGSQSEISHYAPEAPQATIAPQATQSPSIIEKVAVATLQRELDATEAPAQVKKWLGVEDTSKTPKAKPEPAFTAALTGGEEGGRYFSKAQVYLFEAIMSMMQESDVEEAKRLVQQKLVEEKQAEIMAKAKAEFEAMNLDDWADSLLKSGNANDSESA
ncbi:TPA: hypothetical protein ACQZHW_004096 [Enterobacter hormaechei]